MSSGSKCQPFRLKCTHLDKWSPGKTPFIRLDSGVYAVVMFTTVTAGRKSAESANMSNHKLAISKLLHVQNTAPTNYKTRLAQSRGCEQQATKCASVPLCYKPPPSRALVFRAL